MDRPARTARATPGQRRRLRVLAAAALAAAVGLAAAAAISAERDGRLLSLAPQAAHSYGQALAHGNAADAYRMLCTKARDGENEQTFTASLDDRYTGYAVDEVAAGGSFGNLAGQAFLTMALDGAPDRKIEVPLVYEDGLWKPCPVPRTGL